MNGPTAVLKVGGELAIDPASIAAIGSEISALQAAGFSVVLVHGGGPQLDQALHSLGRSSRRVAGRRVTSQRDLETAIQVWRGTLSVAWVSGLTQQGVRACGICGADGMLLQAHRRPETTMLDDNGQSVSVDFGFVGDVDAVNVEIISTLMNANIVPVISPLAIDSASGQLLNVNADTVAAAIAAAINADWLVLLSSIPGLLRELNDPSSRIAKLSLAELPLLIEDGVISGGMRPKVAALMNALRSGVQRALILDGRAPVVTKVLVHGHDAGTELHNDPISVLVNSGSNSNDCRTSSDGIAEITAHPH